MFAQSDSYIRLFSRYNKNFGEYVECTDELYLTRENRKITAAHICNALQIIIIIIVIVVVRAIAMTVEQLYFYTSRFL